jgi:hypothetical protein
VIFPFCALLVAATCLSCSNATATDDAGFPGPSGGDAAGDSALDSGTGFGAADAVETGGYPLPANCLPDGGHGGHGWQDLYACYFGPTGIANCSLNSSCHVAGGPIWVCGATATSCYQGMIGSMVVSERTAGDPTSTLLYFSLRKADGTGGAMPQLPADLSFMTEDMARIDAWIDAGAPNN